MVILYKKALEQLAAGPSMRNCHSFSDNGKKPSATKWTTLPPQGQDVLFSFRFKCLAFNSCFAVTYRL